MSTPTATPSPSINTTLSPQPQVYNGCDVFFPWSSILGNLGFTSIGLIAWFSFAFWVSKVQPLNAMRARELRRALDPTASISSLLLMILRVIADILTFSTFAVRADFNNFPIHPAIHWLEIFVALFLLALQTVGLLSARKSTMRHARRYWVVLQIVSIASMLSAACGDLLAPFTTSCALKSQRLSLQFFSLVDLFQTWQVGLGGVVGKLIRNEVWATATTLSIQSLLIVLCFGCTIYLVEVAGDPEGWNQEGDTNHPAQNGWSLGVAFYFILVTLSTVGYGDFSPSTVVGRFVVCVFIVVGITYFGFATSQMLDLARRQKSGRGRPVFRAGMRHVVLLGANLSDTNIERFLLEFFHESHWVRPEAAGQVLILAPEGQWSHQQRLFIANHTMDFGTRVLYQKGSIGSSEDLMRINLRGADAVFIIPEADSSSGSNEGGGGVDSESVIQCLHVRNFAPSVPVFCVLNQAKNRPLLICSGVLPSNIVCTDEIKFGLLAQNCIAPGSGVLFTRLMNTAFSTFFSSVAALLEKENPLVAEIAHSSSMTLHEIGIHSKYVHGTFGDLAASLWEYHGAILMGEMRQTSSTHTHTNDTANVNDNSNSKSNSPTSDDEYDPLLVENQSRVLLYNADQIVKADTRVIVLASIEDTDIDDGYNRDELANVTVNTRMYQLQKWANSRAAEQNKRPLPPLPPVSLGDMNEQIRNNTFLPPPNLHDHTLLAFHSPCARLSELDHFLRPLSRRAAAGSHRTHSHQLPPFRSNSRSHSRTQSNPSPGFSNPNNPNTPSSNNPSSFVATPPPPSLPATISAPSSFVGGLRALNLGNDDEADDISIGSRSPVGSDAISNGRVSSSVSNNCPSSPFPARSTISVGLNSGEVLCDRVLTHPVVILHPTLPLRSEWAQLARYQNIFFVQGKASDLSDLTRASLHRARGAVVLQGDKSLLMRLEQQKVGQKEQTLKTDADSVFGLLLMETRFMHINPRLRTSLVTEFSHLHNLRLLNASGIDGVRKKQLDPSSQGSGPNTNNGGGGGGERSKLSSTTFSLSAHQMSASTHEELTELLNESDDRTESGGIGLLGGASTTSMRSIGERRQSSGALPSWMYVVWESCTSWMCCRRRKRQHTRRGDRLGINNKSMDKASGTTSSYNNSNSSRNTPSDDSALWTKLQAKLDMEDIRERMSDERYAAGRVHVTSSFASLLALSFLRPWTVAVVRQLLTDSTRYVVHENVPDEFIGGEYSAYVLHRIRSKTSPPLGLWAAIHKRRRNSLPYAVVNPHAATVLRKGDKVFCIATRSQEPVG